MRKVTALVLVFVLIISAATSMPYTSTSAQSGSTVIVLQIGSKTMMVNGRATFLDAPPIILEARTLLPIRAIIEALGGTVAWDAINQQVTVTLQSTTVILWIGQQAARVNGELRAIDPNNSLVVPRIISSRTMLPIRFVAESMGCQVGWDATTMAVTVTYVAPAKESVSKDVNASTGGTIELSNHSGVVVPPNALDSDTSIEVAIADRNSLKGDMSGVIGDPISITTASPVALKELVAVSFSIEGLNLGSRTVAIGYWNEARKGWDDIGGSIDPRSRRITAYIDHFSIFGMLWGSNSSTKALKQQYDYAMTLWKSSSYQNALQEFTRVVSDYAEKTDEDHKWCQYARLYSARCYIKLHDVDKAYECYKEVVDNKSTTGNLSYYTQYEQALWATQRDLSEYFPTGYETLNYLRSLDFFNNLSEYQLPEAYAQGSEDGMNWSTRNLNLSSDKMPDTVKQSVLSYIASEEFDAGEGAIQGRRNYIACSSQTNAQEIVKGIGSFWKALANISSLAGDLLSLLKENLVIAFGKVLSSTYFNWVGKVIVDDDPTLSSSQWVTRRVVLSTGETVVTAIGLGSKISPTALVIKGGDIAVNGWIKKQTDDWDKHGVNFLNLNLGVNPYDQNLGDQQLIRVRNPCFIIWVTLEGPAENGAKHKKMTLAYYLRSGVGENVEVRQSSYWNWFSWFKTQEVTENKGWYLYFKQEESLDIPQTRTPDLTIESISWSPTSPKEGDSIAFTATIKNVGQADAASFNTRLYVAGNVIDTKSTSSLAAGSSNTVAFTGKWTATFGCKDVKVVADPDNTVSESNESNNEMTKQICPEKKQDVAISIRVDRGCASTYKLGDTIRIYGKSSVATQATYVVQRPDTTSTLTRTLEADKETLLAEGVLDGPTGQRTYLLRVTANGQTAEKSCSIIVAASTTALAVDISVDKGCGASYCLGDPIAIYFKSSQSGTATIVDKAPDGGIAVVGTYALTADTIRSISGTITPPTGTETIVMRFTSSTGGYSEAQCSFNVVDCGVSLDIWVNKGCGSTYAIGEYVEIRARSSVSTDATYAAVRPDGTYPSSVHLDANVDTTLVSGNLSGPTGQRTYTLNFTYNGTIKQKSCSINVVSSGGAPTIRVISPNGGEMWGVGHEYVIAWASMGLTQGEIQIFCSRFGSGDEDSWMYVASASLSAHLYNWTIDPATMPGGPLCYIKVVNVYNGTWIVSDVSDAAFVILPEIP